jgi:hypothetical protein
MTFKNLNGSNRILDLRTAHQCGADGLTSREIAQALVYSSEKVKKHTSSTFGKLGVRKAQYALGKVYADWYSAR